MTGETIKCPFCGSVEFQENQSRPTWQPLELVTDDAGKAVDGEYGEFECGDDVEVEGYDCKGCGHSWETLGALDRDRRIVAALEQRIAIAKFDQQTVHIDDDPHDLANLARREEAASLARHDEATMALRIFRTGAAGFGDDTPRNEAQNRAYHAKSAALAALLDEPVDDVKALTLAFASRVLSRPVTSSTELSIYEMGLVLTHLDNEIRKHVGGPDGDE